MLHKRLLRLAFLLLLPCLAYAQKHAPSPEEQKDLAELQAFTLTMDVVNRTYQTMYEAAQASKSDPELKKLSNSADSDTDYQSISALSAKYATYQVIVTILGKHGFTPHQYVVAQLTVLQSGIAAAALKMGADRSKLISNAMVNPANIDFMVQHQAEIEELNKKYPLNDDSN
jgi:hypothetical protein